MPCSISITAGKKQQTAQDIPYILHAFTKHTTERKSRESAERAVSLKCFIFSESEALPQLFSPHETFTEPAR